MKQIQVAIVGANGYTGFELLAILARHPHATLLSAVSRSNAGSKVCEMYPALKNVYADTEFEELDFDKLKTADVVFTALPHTAGAEIGGKLADAGVRLIDLSADFRYDSLALYESTYKVTHPRPDLNKEAVYGLCELNRAQIKTARVVGNPGCYTTASILPLKPLIDGKLIDVKGIIIDAKSGVTGAGRKSDLAYSFCETDDNFKAYSAVGHRHTTEIEEKLGVDALCFTPHLLPLKRGILNTIYARTTQKSTFDNVAAAYEKFYGGEKFVKFCGDTLPELKWVRGSNSCFFGVKIDEKNGLVKIVSCIDNLIKGASGQAVQNMNIMFGFDEDCALQAVGEYL